METNTAAEMRHVWKRVYHAPKGECRTCDERKPGEMMPPHEASFRCESGKHNHCTCDTCF